MGGVIILYCGPPNNQSECTQIGKTILVETGYTNPSKKMFYKTDTQTLKKTIGGHKYTLDIPQSNFDKLRAKQQINSNEEENVNPKPKLNFLSQISKLKKKKKKAITTRVRTRDGKVFTETINANGSIVRKLEGTEVMPRYLQQNESPTKALPSYVYGDNGKW